MLTRTLARIAWTYVLMSGCGAMFGACALTGHAQAQQSSAPAATTAPVPAPSPATQSPTVNPSTPSTAQHPSYRSHSPSTPSTTPSTPNTSSSTPSTVPNTEATSPANERPPTKITAQSEQHTAKPRPVHRYRRHPALVTYSCSHLGCVRTYAWAFPCQYYSRSCDP